jgi:WD40 repeat protein
MSQTDTRADIPSVVERTRALDFGSPVVSAHFLADKPVFALGEEASIWVEPEGEPRRIAAHTGAILSAASGTGRLLTGGDDGKVIATGVEGECVLEFEDTNRRWIDNVACGPQGGLAWSAGKQAFARSDRGGDRTLEAPSTVGGLAFAPKGLRLAIAHYNGVSLWFPNAQSEPQLLPWKGSHLRLAFSPDGKFLVSSMQEPTLHGWRLLDGRDMRMSGYAARVRSFEWTASGDWLATSGANELVLWPFQGKDGPMGKAPRMLAAAQSQVEVVACHPKQDVVAAGYADGLVLLVRVEDGAEILARLAGGAPISALAWSASGDTLLFGTEAGNAGIVALG